MAELTLIVMSDSHGDRDVIENIKTKYLEKVDAIFHNGDSELLFSDPVWNGINVVRGNCDYDSGYQDNLITKLSDITIAQTHGHLYGINFGWDRLNWFAQEANANICLYGHLHRPAAWENNQILFINPGSVLQPRGEINEQLYAKVTITDQMIKVDYFTRHHEIYPSLSKEFKR